MEKGGMDAACKVIQEGLKNLGGMENEKWKIQKKQKKQ